MLSKEAQKSIKKYKLYANFISSMYQNPNNMSKAKRRYVRWLIDLQGILGAKIKGTIKKDVYLCLLYTSDAADE